MFLPADSPDSAEVGEILAQLQKHFSEHPWRFRELGDRQQDGRSGTGSETRDRYPGRIDV